jgi:hypothetical protein
MSRKKYKKNVSQSFFFPMNKKSFAYDFSVVIHQEKDEYTSLSPSSLINVNDSMSQRGFKVVNEEKKESEDVFAEDSG